MCHQVKDISMKGSLLDPFRKVAGSIPDGVIEIFHSHNRSGCTMALGSTQPLKEISAKNISLGVKAAGAWGLQPYHLQVPIVMKSGSLNLLEHPGPVEGLCRDYFSAAY